MANLVIYINNSNIDSPLNTTGVNWVDVNVNTDVLILGNGSDIVADGLGIPTATDIMRAGVILNGTEQIVPKYFLMDDSAAILREIFNMGNKNKQYALAFDFDGATATEPVLEIWDDSGLNTINSVSLGAGIATNSWWRGIVTTYALPGDNWTGNVLAGASVGRYLSLNDNNGPLDAAQTLYCNIKVIIPSTVNTAASLTPKIVVKYASN